MIRIFIPWRLMVSSSWMCIIRLPSPSNSTTVLVRARGRHAHGEGDAVADRTELADREELLLRARRHLREEPRAVARGVHELPVGGQRFLERFDHIARVEQPGLDLEHVAVGFRIADARGHRLGAPHRGCARAMPPSAPPRPVVRRRAGGDAPLPAPDAAPADRCRYAASSPCARADRRRLRGRRGSRRPR